MNISLSPIGILRSHYVRKDDAPRQPHVFEVESQFQRAEIHLFSHQNYEQALEDLAGFQRIWLISWFHRAFSDIFDEQPESHRVASWKPKVLPPRSLTSDGKRKKRGVFATRSPHRPNPIGLTCCDLLEVRGKVVVVGETDLLDGTPILDIKPYLPYCDAFSDSRIGWLEEVDNQLFTVEFSSKADEQIAFLETRNIFLQAKIEHVLSNDPFDHPYRRIERMSEKTYQLSHRAWRIVFEIDQHKVLVHHIRSALSSFFKEFPLQMVNENTSDNLFRGLSDHEISVHRDFCREYAI